MYLLIFKFATECVEEHCTKMLCLT